MYKDTLQKVKRFMTETGMLQNCSEIILRCFWRSGFDDNASYIE
mgnify:CR=1 FL=1